MKLGMPAGERERNIKVKDQLFALDGNEIKQRVCLIFRFAKIPNFAIKNQSHFKLKYFSTNSSKTKS